MGLTTEAGRSPGKRVAGASVGWCLFKYFPLQVSGSVMALFTAKLNLFKNSVKASPELCIILVNEVDFSPGSLTNPKFLKQQHDIVRLDLNL